MNKILRMFFVSLVVLLPIIGVSAKDEEVFCGDLSTVDCDILKENVVADQSLTSLRYSVQMTMSVLQEPSTQPESFSFNSDGVLGYNKADMDAMKDEILNTTIGEVLVLLEDPNALVDQIVSYIERLAMSPTADLNVEIVLPESVEEPIQQIQVELKMIDGVVYITSPLLAMAELPPDMWISLDLIEAVNFVAGMVKDPAFMEGMIEGMGGSVAPMPPDMGGAGSPSGEFQELFARIGEIANAPYWDEMETPEFQAQIQTITRLPDEELDGVTVAVFEEQVDMAAMVESDLFQQAFTDMFTLFSQDTTSEQMEALVPVILDMISKMEIQSAIYIGLDDHFTYRETVSWTMTIDPQAFINAVVPEDEQGDMPEEAMGLQRQSFEFVQDVRDHNQPLEVTPPGEENVISLFAMLMGGAQP